MKRFFSSFCLIIFLILLSSCELNFNINDNNSSKDDGLTNQSVIDVLGEYYSKTSITINDTTTIIGLDNQAGNDLLYKKTTNIDFNDGYIYSEINDSIIEKKLYSYEDKIYEDVNDKAKPLYSLSELTDVYSFTGISALFNSSKFSIKNDEIIFTISGDEIVKYKRLFEQVNIELDRSYSYNP